MLKFGNIASHNYILGAYSTKEYAEHAGEVEKSWRGGKYEPNIVEITIDSKTSGIKILNHWLTCNGNT